MTVDFSALVAAQQWQAIIDAATSQEHTQSPEAMTALGMAYFQTQHITQARDIFGALTQSHPTHIEGWYNYAFTLQHTGEWLQACHALREVLNIQRDNPDVWHNLCVCLQHIGQFEAALAASEQAMKLQPNSAQRHFTHAMLLLTLGQWEKGWPYYESRLHLNEKELYPVSTPRWQGESTDHLLVMAEQGLGDSLQYLRFLPLLSSRAKRITFACQKRLMSLVEAQDLGIQIIHLHDLKDTQPDHDAHIHLLSLPLRLDITPDALPASAGYLNAPPSTITRSGINIGLAWAGSAKHPNDQYRSTQLNTLAPWLAHEHITWHNLCPGHDVDHAEWQSRFVSHSVDTFFDTAEIVSQLDRVITVDTSLAHLCGAMGKPTWMMIPFVPDWRWELGTDTSRWYDSVTLYRQSTQGQWRDVVDCINTALATLGHE